MKLQLAICATILMTGTRSLLAYTGCTGDTTNGSTVIAEYLFREGSGTSTVNLGTGGSAGDAILTNSVTFSADVPPVNGGCGYSAKLPASGTGSLTPAVESSASYDPLAGATNFTIMAWVKRESSSTASNQSARIVSDESSTTLASNSGFALRFSGAAGTLALRVNSTELSTTVGGIAPNDGAWHHVAVVYDGSRPATNSLSRHAHFYVDGVQRGVGVSNATLNVSVGSNANKLTVGNSSVSRGVGNLLVSKTDDVRILRGFAPAPVGDGNTNTVIQCYANRGDDFEPPTITCPDNVTVTAVPGQTFASNVNLGQPTVSDNCGVPNVANNAPAVYPRGTTIVTWTATDGAGNQSTCQQTVTVVSGTGCDGDTTSSSAVIVEYPFSEGTGTSTTNLGTDGALANATLRNGADFTTDVPPSNSSCGRSISLPNTGSGETTPSVETSAAYDPLAGSERFTIMAWVKRQSSAPNQNTAARIVSDEHPRGLSENDGFTFGFTGQDGQLAVRVNDHLAATSVGGGLIPPNEGNWHHVAVTYDGTLPATNTLTRNVHFYVDGVQRGDGNVLVSQIVATNGNPMRVGNVSESPSVSSLLVGKIDDVRILRDYATAAVGNGNISSVISCYMNHNEGGGLAAPEITAPASVCANSTGNSAFITDYGTGATYSWQISNGSITGGQGTPTISWSAASTSPATLNVSVTANGCTASATKDVTVTTSGSVTITAPDSVCANSAGNTASIPDAGTGATYSWAIQNGTITAGQGTPIITWTAGSTGPVSLSVTVSGVACGSTGNKDVTVNVLPDATITAPSSVCANSTGNPASIPDAGQGASYSWTVSGGTIQSGNGTRSITWSAGSSSPVALSATVTANGCSSAGNKDVTVGSSGSVTITASDSVCANSTGNTASVPDAGTGATYSWSIQNGTITAGQGTRSITWSAGSTSPVSLSITVAGVGCGSTGSKNVTANALPDATITAPGSVLPNSTGNAASVPDAGTGATYSWTIAGGTLDGGNGTRSIAWSAGTTSPATLMVTVTTAGCSSTGTKDVAVTSSSLTITSQPINQEAEAGEDTAFSVVASGEVGPISYQWFHNGSVIGVDSTLTIDPIQTTDAGAYYVVVSDGVTSIASDTATLTLIACVSSPAGLVAWWSAEGNTYDNTGKHNGTLSGTFFGTGKIGQAFHFNGISDKVTVADNPEFALTQSLTIEGWIYRESSGRGYILIRSDDDAGIAPYYLSVEASGVVRFFISSGSNSDQLETTVAYAQWQHVAAVLDDSAGQMLIYVNGQAAAQKATSVRPFAELNAASQPAIGIGNHPSSGQNTPFGGFIDELTVYSTALSAHDIGMIFNAGTGKCALGTPRLPAVHFTPAGSSQVPSFVSLAVPGYPASSIHYTVNGTIPTQASPVYSGPIELTQPTTIIAFASLSGFQDGPTAVEKYGTAYATDPSKVSGDKQVGVLNSVLPLPFVALITINGNPVPNGETVTFTATSPSGEDVSALLSRTSDTTGSDGQPGHVSTSLNFGNEAGVYTVTAHYQTSEIAFQAESVTPVSVVRVDENYLVPSSEPLGGTCYLLATVSGESQSATHILGATDDGQNILCILEETSPGSGVYIGSFDTTPLSQSVSSPQDGVTEYASADFVKTPTSSFGDANRFDHEMEDPFGGFQAESRGSARANAFLTTPPPILMSPDFLRAAGFAKFQVHILGTPVYTYIENQADFLYISTHGHHHANYLETAEGDFPPAKISGGAWAKDLDYVIIAGCAVLDVTGHKYQGLSEQNDAPGRKWISTGPCVFLGYEGAGPSDSSGAPENVVYLWTFEVGIELIDPLTAWMDANASSISIRQSCWNATAINACSSPKVAYHFEGSPDNPRLVAVEENGWAGN